MRIVQCIGSHILLLPLLLLLTTGCKKQEKHLLWFLLSGISTNSRSANVHAPNGADGSPGTGNAQPLTTPASFSGIIMGPTQIDLSWSASTGGATAPSTFLYEICQSTVSGGCTGGFTPTYTTTPDSLAYSVTGLNPLTTYYLALRARDGAGNLSGATQEITATTPVNGTVATPTFAPSAGTYPVAQNVTLSSATPGATICYDDTGLTPVCNTAGGGCATGNLYTASLYVSSDRTITAVACLASYTDSLTNSAAYRIGATIGGTVTGLAGTVVLQNNLTDALNIGANGTYTFPTLLPDGATYSVSVNTQPAGQTCIVNNFQGTVAGANVIDVNVSCTNGSDLTPPTTAATPDGYIGSATQSVTLSCADSGSGCRRIVYTTDGTLPTFSPQNGTVVWGSTAGPVAMGAGRSTLRYLSEDNSGNREPYRESQFLISTSGITYAATTGGVGVGLGPNPAQFVQIGSILAASTYHPLFFDSGTGILYLATASGLFISTDGGVTLTRRNGANGLGSNAVHGVFASGSTIFAATAGGLSISTDGGATFVNRTTADGLGSNLVFGGVHASGATLYAPTSGGLSISTDGGATFVNRSTADGLGSNEVYDVFASGNTVYAATFGGLSISTDGGATFVNRTTASGLGSNRVIGVFASGNTLYAATAGGLSISTDGGTTFVNRTIASGLGSNFVADVFASGTTICAATSGGLSISTDGGATFVNRTAASGLGSSSIPGVSASGTTIFAATTVGLSISTNGGATFVNRTTANGLGDNWVSSVFASGTALYAATQSGLSISTDGGTTFVNRTTADGLGSNFVADVFASGTALYAATGGGLSISTNGGTTFINRTTANGLGSNVVNDIFASGTALYAATNSGLSISTNGGTTFVNRTIASGLGSNQIIGVFTSGTKVYAATTGGLSISTDGGTTFVNRTTANGLGDNRVIRVFASGTALYAATVGGLSISTDGGASFVNRTTADGLGSNMVNGVLYVP